MEQLSGVSVGEAESWGGDVREGEGGFSPPALRKLDVLSERELVVQDDPKELGAGRRLDGDAGERDREGAVVLGVAAAGDEVKQLEFGEVKPESGYCTPLPYEVIKKGINI